MDERSWEAAVRDAVHVPPGALPAVARALAGSRPRAEAGAVLVEGQGGAVVLPHVRVEGRLGWGCEAMPHGIPCGPITVEGQPGPLDGDDLRRTLGAQQLRVYVHHSLADAYEDRPHATHVVDLSGDAPVSDGYRQRARRKLRAAANAGVETQVCGADDSARVFEVLASAAETEERPSHPAPVIDAVLASGCAFGVLATHEGRDISAALFLVSSLEALYWLGGTLPDAKELSPGYATIDAAIHHARENACLAVNLGASYGLPGVAHFKEGFGARPVTYPSLSSRSARSRVAGAADALKS